MSKKQRSEVVKRPGGYVAMQREWFNSEAYRDLSRTARCLLAEIHNLYMPARNGRISLSVANGASRLNVTEKTIRPAYDELAEHGFIALTKGQMWQQRMSREWRVTFERCDGLEPTDEWRRWKPGHPVATLPKKGGK
ncbi:hypothetical protein [Marinobacter sp. ELB17]|uniref:hypothetical protein n=1 Tax=Marinobacter sp. ELB17 TaxID=270374 RepID=UPI0000F37EED|nr:hypothetical protein [Marinobacter sp. ELB17]EBA00262.1 hypothetical protein MELB17_04062 [Marinobacter sp. ELB17]